MNLTTYLSLGRVSKAWGAYFQGTTSYIAALNKQYQRDLIIPPSSWTQQKRRHGCVGTAYGYLVDPGNTGQFPTGLGNALADALYVARRQRLMIPFFILGVLLLMDSNQPREKAEDRWDERCGLDFYRGLGALADLEVVRRRMGLMAPRWMYGFESFDLSVLRTKLAENYPDEFAIELRQLIAVTSSDFRRVLPEPKLGSVYSVFYNPQFGTATGGCPLAADGDLILNDLLLELKVTTQLFDRDYIRQLLGYAALDSWNGRKRIKRIGIYNPRYRVFWEAPLEDVVKKMGGTTFKHFCDWFHMQRNLAAGSKELDDEARRKNRM